jgi:hypothetical protein
MWQLVEINWILDRNVSVSNAIASMTREEMPEVNAGSFVADPVTLKIPHTKASVRIMVRTCETI